MIFCKGESRRKAFFKPFRSHNRKIKKAVCRIEHMENLFDKVSDILKNRPEALSSQDIIEDVKVLSDYYSCGDWLNDYELDEQRLLPPDLKRGVLSQDSLYDLLCSMDEVKP